MLEKIMNIGIDYDGTIADTNLYKSLFLKQKYRIEIPSWKCDRTECIPELEKHFSPQEANKIYKNFHKIVFVGKYAGNAKQVAGAKESIIELSKTHNIYIITARYDYMINYANKWLDKKDLSKYIQGIYSTKIQDSKLKRVLPKKDICKQYKIDIIIDDDERHLKDISNVKKILFKNNSPEKYDKKGLFVAKNWQEIVSYINNI